VPYPAPAEWRIMLNRERVLADGCEMFYYNPIACPNGVTRTIVRTSQWHVPHLG
jgi:hypothetical protein